MSGTLRDGVWTATLRVPEAAPSDVPCPSRTFSTRSQAREAAAVATRVLTKTRLAVPLAASAEPALKPIHQKKRASWRDIPMTSIHKTKDKRLITTAST